MTKSDQNSGIILNPYEHCFAVNHFLEFYKIKAAAPDIEFLKIILTFYSKLPYENISKIVKLSQDYTNPLRIRLPEEVMENHAQFFLGGTCYALTFFLQSILSEKGFSCYPVTAHMNARPNAHCALIVTLNSRKYLCDPGYLLNQPMEIHPDKARWYRTPHTGVELVFNPKDEYYNLYTFDSQKIKWRYCFLDNPLNTQEFIKLWLDSFYLPAMRGICLTRVNQDGMIYVHNNYIQVQNIYGKQKGKIEDLHQVILKSFGIPSEWVERAQAAIPNIISLGQQHGFYNKM